MWRGVERGVARGGIALLGLVGLLGLVRSAEAQAIRGRLVEAATGRPVPGAIVEVHDAAGYLTKRVVSSPSGAFVIPLSTSGTYRLGTRAIGYRPASMTGVEVGSGVLVLPDIGLARVVFTLPDLVKVAEGSCVNQGTDRAAFADLLAAFGSSLTVVEQAITLGTIEFETEIIDRTIRPATLAQRRAVPARTLDTIADTLRRAITYWPVHSLSVDSLRRFGFAVERWEGGQGSWTLYGPDPTVLFSPWFMETHCFALDRPVEGADSLVLRFTPRRRSQVGDIAGELVVEAATLAPRELRFRFTTLPLALNGVDPSSIAGVLTFDREDSGIWFVNRWRMWSPILAERRRIGGTEVDGRVVSARPDH